MMTKQGEKMRKGLEEMEEKGDGRDKRGAKEERIG